MNKASLYVDSKMKFQGDRPSIDPLGDDWWDIHMKGVTKRIVKGSWFLGWPLFSFVCRDNTYRDFGCIFWACDLFPKLFPNEHADLKPESTN